MKAHEARRRVVDHLEDSGMVVYEQRVRHGLPAMGQVVMVDPGNGTCRLVRVQVGKRPRPHSPLLHDKRRVGLCDLLAIVDPRDGCVHLSSPVPRGNTAAEDQVEVPHS